MRKQVSGERGETERQCAIRRGNVPHSVEETVKEREKEKVRERKRDRKTGGGTERERK